MKSLNKRGSVLLLSFMMMFTIVLAACSKNDDGANSSPSASVSESPSASPSESASAEPSASAAPEDEPVTLKFLTWIPVDEKWEKLIALFNAKYPNIKVEMFNAPGTPINTVLQQNIAAGEPVDVFWGSTLWEHFSSGYVENLQPFIDKSPEFQAYPFLKGINDFKIGTDTYGLSRGNDLGLIFYNKDLLEKYGMEPPAVNWTFDDMREMAKKATNAAEKTWGFNNNSYNSGWLVTSLPWANGHVDNIYGLNEAKDKSMLTGDNTAALTDLDYWLDIVTKDQSMLNFDDSNAAGIGGGSLWGSGQALFNYDISYMIANNGGLKFKWDIATIPAGTAKQGNFALNSPMFMASASKHKEAAWKFMEFWTSNKDFQKTLAEVGYTFPNSSDPDIQSSFAALPMYAAVNQEHLAFAYNNAQYDPTATAIGGNFAADVGNEAAGQTINWKHSAFEQIPAKADEMNGKIAAAIEQANKILNVQTEAAK